MANTKQRPHTGSRENHEQDYSNRSRYCKEYLRTTRGQRTGKTVKRQTLNRSKVLECFANLEPCLVGIESCTSSQHWAREISQFGHTVKRMNARA